jgi:hypothetical protein
MLAKNPTAFRIGRTRFARKAADFASGLQSRVDPVEQGLLFLQRIYSQDSRIGSIAAPGSLDAFPRTRTIEDEFGEISGGVFSRAVPAPQSSWRSNRP